MNWRSASTRVLLALAAVLVCAGVVLIARVISHRHERQAAFDRLQHADRRVDPLIARVGRAVEGFADHQTAAEKAGQVRHDISVTGNADSESELAAAKRERAEVALMQKDTSDLHDAANAVLDIYQSLYGESTDVARTRRSLATYELTRNEELSDWDRYISDTIDELEAAARGRDASSDNIESYAHQAEHENAIAEKQELELGSDLAGLRDRLHSDVHTAALARQSAW